MVDRLSPLHGKIDSQTISFVYRTFTDLQDWYTEWHAIHRQRHAEDSVLVKLLEAELVYAQMWTVCVALRGCAWDRVRFGFSLLFDCMKRGRRPRLTHSNVYQLDRDQRELAFQAKDAALRCLEIFLKSPNFRAHLKCEINLSILVLAFCRRH